MDVPPGADSELARLADVVGVERTVAEHLAFKLVALDLVLAAGLLTYVGRCLDEVEVAWERLGRVEERRTSAVAALATAWGCPPVAVTLAELGDHAPEPWATVFADHRDHLGRLRGDIERAGAASAERCARALGEVDADLATLAGTRERVAGARAGGPGRALQLVGRCGA